MKNNLTNTSIRKDIFSKFKFFILTMILTFTIIGCEKEFETNNLVESTTEHSQKPTLENEQAYAHFYLNIYAHFLSNLSNDLEIKNIVHKEVSKKFDGDSNILINQLFKTLKENGIDVEYLLTEHLNKYFSSVSYQELNNAFIDIDGSNYYAQVFVPFYDDLDLKGSNSVAVHPFNGPMDSEEMVKAYQLLNEEINTIQINEAYAQNNEVWVISINESVDNDGKLSTAAEQVKAMTAKISTMTVIDGKESWAQGKSEVSFRGFFTTYNGMHPNENNFLYDGYAYINEILEEQQSWIPAPGLVEECDYPANIVWYDPYDFNDDPDANYCWTEKGEIIRKFKKNWIKNETEIDVNFTIMENWETDKFIKDPLMLVYIIFEYDPWPASKDAAPIPAPSYIPTGGVNLNSSWGEIAYRSYESTYDKRFVSGNEEAENYLGQQPCFNNNSIEYCFGNF